jgi:hypothetical protein
LRFAGSRPGYFFYPKGELRPNHEEEETMADDDNSGTDEATREAERLEAQQAHVADRPPTADEETEAAKSREAYASESGQAAEHYQEMTDIGAHVEGEGAID